MRVAVPIGMGGYGPRILRAGLQALCLALAVATYGWGATRAAHALTSEVRTDANIITAIDISDSIGRHEEWLQQTGLARALLDPDFLHAATAGPQRRIGFAVFTWSSNGRCKLLIPWTIIGSSEEAARVSTKLASAMLVDRSQHGGGDHEDARPDKGDTGEPARLTDISAAIGHGSALLLSAPYATSRSVVNICANGFDNVGDADDGGTRRARDRAVAQGLTVNGLAVGADADVARYFRANVIGGSGAFVMELSRPDHAGYIMARKLERDMLVALSAQDR